MDPDGSDQTNLTDNETFEGEPAWSADGSKIAFTTFRDGSDTAEIYVMNADGTGRPTSQSRSPTTNPPTGRRSPESALIRLGQGVALKARLEPQDGLRVQLRGRATP